jgi:hypothetical protein
MNKINPEPFSAEWYELTSTEELQRVLLEARKAFPESTGARRRLWRVRLGKIEEELLRRETSIEDWPETVN